MRQYTANHGSRFLWIAAALLSSMGLAGGCGLDDDVEVTATAGSSGEIRPGEELLVRGAVADDREQNLIARYGMFCIHNGTSHSSINYSIQWGDGDRTEYSVTSARWHSWEYATPGEPDAPTVHIEFDSDFSDDTSWVRYLLRTTPSPEQTCASGTQYRFEDDGETGRYIDLYEVI